MDPDFKDCYRRKNLVTKEIYETHTILRQQFQSQAEKALDHAVQSTISLFRGQLVKCFMIF